MPILQSTGLRYLDPKLAHQNAERIMIEGIVERVAPLSGYAWIKQHEKKLRLQEVERQQHTDELVEKAAPEFVKELIRAGALNVLEHQGAASWREAALKRLQLIYAGEQTGFLPPGISSQFVVKAGDVLSGADVSEDTKSLVVKLLNELTTEVTSRR